MSFQEFERRSQDREKTLWIRFLLLFSLGVGCASILLAVHAINYVNRSEAALVEAIVILREKMNERPDHQKNF